MADEYDIKSPQRHGAVQLLGLHQQQRAPGRCDTAAVHSSAAVGSLLGHHLWSNNRIGLNPQGSPTDLVEITALDGSVYVIASCWLICSTARQRKPPKPSAP